jgi:hypothetical protein
LQASESITQCSNGYILEINGRSKKDDYLNIKHLVLKHEELVDVLIEVDQAIRQQRYLSDCIGARFAGPQ